MVYKNYVNSDQDDKKEIRNELDKRVKYDDLEAKTFKFDKASGGILSLGGAGNGNGELSVKDDAGTEKVKISNLGITLADDTKLIGGDGVLSTSQYPAYNVGWFGGASTANGYWFLGYNSNFLDANWGNWLEFNVDISADFTITEAKITLFHSPVYWDNGGDYALWGWCRNIKAYTATNYNTVTIEAAYASEYESSYTYTLSEIASAFGASGFTANTPSTPSHNGQITTSADIKASLSTGFNKIVVKSSDYVPSYNADLATNATAIGAKTGYVFAILNITGFKKG